MSQIVNNEHYVIDSCLGGSFLVDGKNAYTEFNADVYDISYGAGSIDLSYEEKVGGSGFSTYHSSFSPQQLTISFYVGGVDKADALLNSNKLIAACSHAIIRYEDEDAFEFASVLTAFNVEFTEVEWFFSVELTFDAVRRMLEDEFVSSSAESTFEVFNYGTKMSGVTIAITSESAQQSLSVSYKDRFGNMQTMTITEVKANVPVVIDGVNGEVLENGVNVFNRTDLVMFPMVFFGSNKFTASKPVTWNVKFYPTFEI